MAVFLLGIPLWAWAVGGAGMGTAAVMATPQGQKVLQDTLSRPFARTRTVEECRPCPVCGACIANPGPTPAYVTENRVPQASETIMNGYTRASGISPVQGAAVYNFPGGGYIHVDKFHRGRGAELERYDSRGKHTGSVCPNCGRPRGGPVPGRTLY